MASIACKFFLAINYIYTYCVQLRQLCFVFKYVYIRSTSHCMHMWQSFCTISIHKSGEILELNAITEVVSPCNMRTFECKLSSEVYSFLLLPLFFYVTCLSTAMSRKSERACAVLRCSNSSGKKKNPECKMSECVLKVIGVPWLKHTAPRHLKHLCRRKCNSWYDQSKA